MSSHSLLIPTHLLEWKWGQGLSGMLADDLFLRRLSRVNWIFLLRNSVALAATSSPVKDRAIDRVRGREEEEGITTPPEMVAGIMGLPKKSLEETEMVELAREWQGRRAAIRRCSISLADFWVAATRFFWAAESKSLWCNSQQLCDQVRGSGDIWSSMTDVVAGAE